MLRLRNMYSASFFFFCWERGGVLTQHLAYTTLLVGKFREEPHWLIVNSQKRRYLPFGSCLWCCRLHNLRVGKDPMGPVVQWNSQCYSKIGTSLQSLTGLWWLNTERRVFRNCSCIWYCCESQARGIVLYKISGHNW